jgi:hypothetical protein
VTKEENRQFQGPEPSVLDWVKSLLKLQPIRIPGPDEYPEIGDSIATTTEASPVMDETILVPSPAVDLEDPDDFSIEKIPSILIRRFSTKYFRLSSAVLLALIAQFSLESRPTNVLPAVFLYLLAGFLAGWSVWAGDFQPSLPESVEEGEDSGKARLNFLTAGAFLTILTYFASRNNEFTPLNLFLWVSALTCMLIAFWEGENPFVRFRSRIISLWTEREIEIQIKPWHVLVTASILLITFFRFTRINEVPYEMWSDHAEKLWDVMDVLEGRTSIFFPRNTGREALQFYMAAATAKVLGTGISYNTLKIGTILAGLFTLPYLYLFAKEFGGRYVGLAAVLFAGIAYWPNVISRIGLRFPLYPLFAAPALYYLLRGLRLQRRNDFLLCGFAVGVGLHGYSPFRVVPVAVFIGVLIYILLTKSKEKRIKAVIWLSLAGVIALVIFTPLLGAVTNMMDLYLGRMVSRFIESDTTPIPGHPLLVLIKNVWKGLTMFAWDNGEVWVVSVPHRPALDWVTGAFFHLGVVIVFVRFIKQRRWQDLFLLLLIPVLMIPSVLALTFPGENPAINRASGAIVPVFTLVAISWVHFSEWLWTFVKARARPLLAISITAFVLLGLVYISARSNYGLVFEEYAIPHRRSTWNTSEIGAVIKGFASTIGSYETAHVIPYEHWVDTRLVGINAGDPKKDYAVWPWELENIPPEPDRPQLFIFKPEDHVAISTLQELHPNGVLKHGDSEMHGRDFMLFYVFPDKGIEIDSLLPVE